MKASVILLLLLSSQALWAKTKKKVKVKYRSHTQFDFAGDQIDGKVKGAGVFYIFQRKRSKGHRVITPPKHFTWHKNRTIATIISSLEGKK